MLSVTKRVQIARESSYREGGVDGQGRGGGGGRGLNNLGLSEKEGGQLKLMI